MERTTNEIQVTTNYRKFKFLKENRDPKHWEKILGSIRKKDMTKYKPIVVDRHFNIIDGQGTFLACKHDKKPIYYVQGDDIGSEDLAQLNTNQTNWDYEDSLKFYCARKFKEYRKIKAIMAETGLRVSEIIRLWNRDQVVGIRASKAFTDGLYRFPAEAQERARQVKRVYQKVVDNFPQDKKLSNPSALVGGVIICFNIAEFQIDEMLRTIDLYPYCLEPKGKGGDYADMLLAIYNRHKSKKNHISR